VNFDGRIGIGRSEAQDGNLIGGSATRSKQRGAVSRGREEAVGVTVLSGETDPIFVVDKPPRLKSSG
jgi:hypothetical protein